MRRRWALGVGPCPPKGLGWDREAALETSAADNKNGASA